MDDYIIVKSSDYSAMEKKKKTLTLLTIVVSVVLLVSAIEIVFCLKTMSKMNEYIKSIAEVSQMQHDTEKSFEVAWRQQQKTVDLISSIGEYIRMKNSMLSYNSKNIPFNESGRTK